MKTLTYNKIKNFARGRFGEMGDDFMQEAFCSLLEKGKNLESVTDAFLRSAVRYKAGEYFHAGKSVDSPKRKSNISQFTDFNTGFDPTDNLVEYLDEMENFHLEMM